MTISNSITSTRSKNRFKTLEAEFVQVHNGVYDYSNTVYAGATKSLNITCKIHGVFQQGVHKHLRGQGCPICAQVTRNKSKSKGKEYFTAKANKVHNNKYVYFKDADYSSMKVSPIVCSIHGTFRLNMNQHIDQKRGCPDCGNTRKSQEKKLTTDQFIELSINMHGKVYDYSESIYDGQKNKITINCRVHGPFQQIPSQHYWHGQGCPNCAIYGFNKSMPAILYYLQIKTDNITLYKVGITNRTIDERFMVKDLKMITVLYTEQFHLGLDAYTKEQNILKDFKSDKYIGPAVLSSGNTELFTTNILNK